MPLVYLYRHTGTFHRVRYQCKPHPQKRQIPTEQITFECYRVTKTCATYTTEH